MQRAHSGVLYILILFSIFVVLGGQQTGYAAVSSGNVSLADSLRDVELGSVEGQVTDIWGYQDPSDGQEYALVCFKQQIDDPEGVGGTAIVDVTNVQQPGDLQPPLGIMPSGEAHDVKTYIAPKTGDIYAYIANGIADDMKIFNISNPANPQLVGAIPVGGANSGTLVHQVHNLYIDDNTL